MMMMMISCDTCLFCLSMGIREKYESIDGFGFSTSRYTLKMAAMTSFHTEKCCHLVSAHAPDAAAYVDQ